MRFPLEHLVTPLNVHSKSLDCFVFFFNPHSRDGNFAEMYCRFHFVSSLEESLRCSCFVQLDLHVDMVYFNFYIQGSYKARQCVTVALDQKER